MRVIAAIAALVVFLSCSSLSRKAPPRVVLTSQGVLVSSVGDVLTPAVDSLLAAIVADGLCSTEQLGSARVMMVTTPALERAGKRNLVLGVHWSDGSIIIAALSFMTGTRWERVLIHEFAHHCHGDGDHKDKALWERVDRIATSLGY